MHTTPCKSARLGMPVWQQRRNIDPPRSTDIDRILIDMLLPFDGTWNCRTWACISFDTESIPMKRSGFDGFAMFLPRRVVAWWMSSSHFIGHFLLIHHLKNWFIHLLPDLERSKLCPKKNMSKIIPDHGFPYPCVQGRRFKSSRAPVPSGQ